MIDKVNLNVMLNNIRFKDPELHKTLLFKVEKVFKTFEHKMHALDLTTNDIFYMAFIHVLSKEKVDLDTKYNQKTTQEVSKFY